MKILIYSSTGPAVQLLQTALVRAGAGDIEADGIFGNATRAAVRRFQAYSGLDADGIVGENTERALMPYYTGFAVHRVRRGDTVFSVARQYGTSPEAVLTANPQLEVQSLAVGSQITVPLPFDLVPTGIRWFSELVTYCVRGLCARYPFIGSAVFGHSVMGKPLYCLGIGSGQDSLLYSACHHANEWITIPVLLHFLELFAREKVQRGSLFGQSAQEIFEKSRIYIVPCVDPDGLDLVTGYLTGGRFYGGAAEIARSYPAFPFPSGWKANILGTDLNLQYPAGWEKARENKFAQGIVSPAPADFVGTSPLSAPESRAMYDLTLSLSPKLTLAYHTQGRVIYWKYLDYLPPRSREIAEAFSAVSGYPAIETPYASGFAGYKDWFIESFNRPGYTVEAGLGTNPLPISQFDGIFADNLGILTLAPLLI